MGYYRKFWLIRKLFGIFQETLKEMICVKIWIQNYNQYDCSKEIKVVVYKMRAVLMSFMNIFLVLKRFENK